MWGCVCVCVCVCVRARACKICLYYISEIHRLYTQPKAINDSISGTLTIAKSQYHYCTFLTAEKKIQRLLIRHTRSTHSCLFNKKTHQPVYVAFNSQHVLNMKTKSFNAQIILSHHIRTLSA